MALALDLTRFLACQIVGDTQKRHLIWVNCMDASAALRQTNMARCGHRHETRHPIEGTPY
jgi:hypothetical protein